MAQVHHPSTYNIIALASDASVSYVSAGEGDPVFVLPGAEAFKRDLPRAKGGFALLDGGHFLLETKVEEVAEEVLRRC